MGIWCLFLIMMSAVFPAGVASFRDRRQHLYDLHGPPNARCVDIPQNLSLCHNIGYNRMRLPNLLDHETLQEVSQQSAFWTPLLASKCSSNTRLFLCSLFSPVCLDQPVYPCRSLCEGVKEGCLPRMAKFGFPWPDMFSCHQFPADNQLCIAAVNIEDNSEMDNSKIPPNVQIEPPVAGDFGLRDNSDFSGRNRTHHRKTHNTGNRNSERKGAVHRSRKKQGVKETLKRGEVVKTLELICKSDFVARIEPTSVHSVKAASQSRITSKRVVFFKTDDSVIQTAKAHPADIGTPHNQRYHFYTSDILLVKLFQRSSHPAFNDDTIAKVATDDDMTGLASILTPSKASESSKTSEELDKYKIHKNDQLLVAGNKSATNGKHSRLQLSLMMHFDKNTPLYKKIIKMFKESSDFCKEAEILKDPINGVRRFENFLPSNRGNANREDDSLKFDSEERRQRKNHHKEKKQNKHKKSKLDNNAGEVPKKRNFIKKHNGDHSKRKAGPKNEAKSTTVESTLSAKNLRKSYRPKSSGRI